MMLYYRACVKARAQARTSYSTEEREDTELNESTSVIMEVTEEMDPSESSLALDDEALDVDDPNSVPGKCL